MNDRSIARLVYFTTMFLVFLLPLAGCGAVLSTSGGQSQAALGATVDHDTDHSLRTAGSQALLAFAQFRLYSADNNWEAALGALERALAFDPQSTYLQLLLARVYLHLERPDAAEILLTQLINQPPFVPEPHLLLGDIYLMQQRGLDAVDHFNQALELAPDNESLHLRLAMAFVQLGRVEEALATLEELLQKRPDADQAMLSLARIYRDSRQPDAAIRVYRRYLETYPVRLPVVLELGQVLQEHDPASAVSLYLKTLDQVSFAPSIRQQLAQLYLARQQPQLALEQLLIVREQLPSLLGGNQIGLLYLHLNQWQQASEEFRRLVDRGDAAGNNRYFLALALIGQSRYPAAIEQLQQVPPEATIYRDAMLQLSYLQLQEGMVDEGTRLLQDLLAQGIDDSEVYYYLVAFYQEQQDLTSALNFAREGISLHPEDARLLYQQGLIFEARKNHQAALEVMERVLLIDAEHADALNFLAYSQAEAGLNLPLALERAKLALQLKPAGYIEDTLGWVYFKLGDYSRSRIHLERATATQPDDQVILEHLGDLYQVMELYAEAIQAYRDALAVDPEAQGVQEKLDQLQREFRP
ncbi:tetratricopeptide repeat protein [Pelovirga terrestris]|uniref:Tetratricopeptide repeat protein n=1 Tax=Pelovirga terrestris TaxID=2771352 RepID=A0A8J6QZ27_9BACT|nr:tetratricopeptide repeat protein [Pelovirga terrestris]MBD1400992.1 tetratricopeptide repeat protein [Pelovirga terrestris]